MEVSLSMTLYQLVTICSIFYLSESAVLVSRTDASYDPNPGLKTRISQLGVSKIADVAVVLASEKLMKLTFPSISGEAKVKGITIKYTVENIKVDRITKPNFSTATIPDVGLHLVVDDVSVFLSGNWDSHWGIVKDSGAFNVRASNLRLHTDFQFGFETGGKPTVSLKQCSGAFTDIDLTIHAKMSWFYDLFKKEIEKRANVPCTFAQQLINEVAKSLHNFDMQAKFLNKTALDFRLLQAPGFSSESIDLLLKGEFFYIGDSTEAPFEPQPFPPITSSKKMLNVLVSDYVVNTLSYALYNHDFMRGIITKRQLPVKLHDFFNTTCTSFLCIGFIIPQLGELFPNSSVEVEYGVTALPKLDISAAGVSSSMKSLHMFRARLPNDSLVDLFGFAVNASGELAVSIDKSSPTLYWKLFKFSISSDLEKNNIGWFPSWAMSRALEWGIRLLALPRINKLGSNGMKLPIPKQVSLNNSRLVFGDHYVQFETDVDYRSSTKLPNK